MPIERGKKQRQRGKKYRNDEKSRNVNVIGERGRRIFEHDVNSNFPTGEDLVGKNGKLLLLLFFLLQPQT